MHESSRVPRQGCGKAEEASESVQSPNPFPPLSWQRELTLAKTPPRNANLELLGCPRRHCRRLGGTSGRFYAMKRFIRKKSRHMKTSGRRGRFLCDIGFMATPPKTFWSLQGRVQLPAHQRSWGLDTVSWGLWGSKSRGRQTFQSRPAMLQGSRKARRAEFCIGYLSMFDSPFAV